MAIERTYLCNLCRVELDPHYAIGIHWAAGTGWTRQDGGYIENHLCSKCLSSIQAMPPMCGQGFNCTGGPRCGSDHK